MQVLGMVLALDVACLRGIDAWGRGRAVGAPLPKKPCVLRRLVCGEGQPAWVRGIGRDEGSGVTRLTIYSVTARLGARHRV
jgi:hypothetical protein